LRERGLDAFARKQKIDVEHNAAFVFQLRLHVGLRVVLELSARQERSGFAQKSLRPDTGLPPDVRRGSATPSDLKLRTGLSPWSGLSPNEGQSPSEN